MKNILIILLLLTGLYADSIHFNNGAILKGRILTQNDSTVTISIANVETIYAMKDVKSIKKDIITAPPPPAPVISAPPSNSQEVKAGSVIHTVTTQAIDSRQFQTGHQFKRPLRNQINTNPI